VVYFPADSHFIDCTFQGKEEHARGSSGLKFEVQETKRLQIGNKSAYQGVAISKDKAEFVATVVYHGDFITVAGLVYPVDRNRAFPCKCYNDFVDSVTEAK
jgi:hypothetical protein